MFSAASNTLMISAKQRILLPTIFHISGCKWCFWNSKGCNDYRELLYVSGLVNIFTNWIIHIFYFPRPVKNIVNCKSRRDWSRSEIISKNIIFNNIRPSIYRLLSKEYIIDKYLIRILFEKRIRIFNSKAERSNHCTIFEKRLVSRKLIIYKCVPRVYTLFGTK